MEMVQLSVSENLDSSVKANLSTMCIVALCRYSYLWRSCVYKLTYIIFIWKCKLPLTIFVSCVVFALSNMFLTVFIERYHFLWFCFCFLNNDSFSNIFRSCCCHVSENHATEGAYRRMHKYSRKLYKLKRKN